MKIAVAAAVCIMVVAIRCSGEQVDSQSTHEPQAALGVVWVDDGSSYVTRLDPRSLKPLPGPRADLSAHSGPWAFSPDGSRVAFGGARKIRIIDVEQMRVIADIPRGARGLEFVGAISWPEPRRLLVVTGMNWENGVSVEVVEPVGRRVLSRWALGGSLQDYARTADGLVLLLGPQVGIGPARLAVASASGGIGSVVLSRVPAGFRTEELKHGFSVDHFRTPGVAVDPRRRRAFIVWADDEIAEVDLTNLRVTYHSVTQPVSLLGRLHDWLEPSAEAKGASDGSVRRALWLGDGLIAVSGSDDKAFFDPGGQQKQRTEPAGVALVDTEDWSKRMLARRATFASRADDLLLAFGSRWDSDTGSFEGAGLSAYDREGKRLFHLFGDEPVGSVETWGPYAYVTFDDSYVCREVMMDLRERMILREFDPDPACSRPTLLARPNG